MKKDIRKRVIVNGSTGGSWLFKLFNKISIIVTDKTAFNDILETWFFFSLLSIDLVQFESIDESQQNEPLSFSNDEYDETEQDDNFVDDSNDLWKI